MGVKVRTTRVALNTSTGNQDITIPGFALAADIKAALFIVSSASINATDTADAILTAGLATSSVTRRANSAFSEDNVGTMNAEARGAAFDTLIVVDGAGGLAASADFVAFIEDGVRINVETAPATGLLCTVTLWAGEDVSVEMGSLTSSATQDGTITPGASFEFDHLIAISSDSPYNDVTSTDATLSIGFCNNNHDGTFSQGCQAIFDEDAAAACNVGLMMRDNRVSCAVATPGGGSAERAAIEITAATASNFTVTTRDHAAAMDLAYLIINYNERARHWVGNDINAPTTTGNWVNNDLGFQPQFMMLGMNLSRATNTIEDDLDAGAFAISAFDENSEFTTGISIDYGADPSNTQSRSDAKAVFLRDDAGTTTEFDGALTLFLAEGYNIYMTTADATQRHWIGLAVGEYLPSTDVRVKTTQVLTNTATGDQDITIPGLGAAEDIKAAMFVISGGESAGSETSHARMGVGFTDGTTHRVAGYHSESASSRTDTDNRGATDEVIQLMDNAGGILLEANFKEFITDGVRITWGVAPGTAKLLNVTFWTGDAVSAEVIQFATAVTQDTTVSPTANFEFDHMILATHRNDFDDARNNDVQLSVGFCDNDGAGTFTQGCYNMREDHNQADGEPLQSVLNNRVVGDLSDSALLSSGEVTAADSSSFTVTTRDAGGGVTCACLIISYGGAAEHWVGNFDSPASGDGTGNFKTTTGHRTQFGMIMGGNMEVVNTFVNSSLSGAFSLGAWHVQAAGDNDYSATTRIRSGVATTATNSEANISALVIRADGGTINKVARGWSAEGDGFLLNYSTNNGNAKKLIGLSVGERIVTDRGNMRGVLRGVGRGI